jgi:hypothetical protein
MRLTITDALSDNAREALLRVVINHVRAIAWASWQAGATGPSLDIFRTELPAESHVGAGMRLSDGTTLRSIWRPRSGWKPEGNE